MIQTKWTFLYFLIRKHPDISVEAQTIRVTVMVYYGVIAIFANTLQSESFQFLHITRFDGVLHCAWACVRACACGRAARAKMG